MKTKAIITLITLLGIAQITISEKTLGDIYYKINEVYGVKKINDKYLLVKPKRLKVGNLLYKEYRGINLIVNYVLYKSDWVKKITPILKNEKLIKKINKNISNYDEDNFDMDEEIKYLDKNLNDFGQEISGINIFKRKKFKYFNKDFVNWASENMIPDSNTSFGDKTTGLVYNVVYKKFFRSFVKSYLLIDSLGFEKETKLYIKKSKDKNEYIPAYLYEKYNSNLLPINTNKAGFWIRRNIDGSKNAFWNGLKKIMMEYDKDYYITIQK